MRRLRRKSAPQQRVTKRTFEALAENCEPVSVAKRSVKQGDEPCVTRLMRGARER